MKPLKEKISITGDGEVFETICAEAEKDDRSLSQYINLILKEHVKKNRNEYDEFVLAASDFNGDGKVSANDVTALIMFIAATA